MILKKHSKYLKQTCVKNGGNEAIIDVANKPKVNVISFGSYKLDYTSGVGGLVCGRLTQLYGESGSGKTTLTTLLAKSALDTYPDKKVLIIDAEFAQDPDYALKLGLNMYSEDVVITQPESGREALDVYVAALESGAFSLCILDSIPSLIPDRDLEADVGDRQVGTLASLLSAEVRKVIGAAKKTDTAALMINQIRAGIGFGQPEKVIPGGNAMKFYPSVNIEIKRVDLIKKGEDYIGQTVRANFVKNRFSNPYKKCDYNLYYGEGIRKSEEACEVAKEMGIIIRAGSWYTIPLANGFTNRLQGMESVIGYYNENPIDFESLEKLVISSFTKKDIVEKTEDDDLEEEIE